VRLLFVNPTLAEDFSALDIAITVLASVVNAGGRHRAAICDLTFHRRHWQRTLDLAIARHRPALIAMSTNTMYMKFVRLVADYAARVHGLPVLVGGHHATRFPEETMALGCFAHLLTGDAEETLPGLLDRLEANLPAEDLPGYYRRLDGNTLRPAAPGRFYQDLHRLPHLDWDLWEELPRYFYYLGMLYMIGSRGCPYRCTFCDAVGLDNAAEGSYFRLAPPEQYAKELAWQWEKYRGKGLRLAQLFDPVFTLNKPWVLAFAKAYIATGAHREFGYSVFSRIDNLDQERIEALAESGCKLLRVGIEAGNERVRKNTYAKNISNHEVRRIITLARKHGLGFTTFFILGGPSEDRRTMLETIRLAREVNPRRSAFFIYKPFTSEGLKQLREHGCSVHEDRWAAADNISFGAVFDSPNFSRAEVQALQHLAYSVTFGQRLLGMLREHPVLYFARLFAYVGRGLADGLSPAYLAMYFHVYGYDYIDH